MPDYLRTYLPEHMSASDVWNRIRLADLYRMAPGPLGTILTRAVLGTPHLSPLLSIAAIMALEHHDATAEEWPRLLKNARRHTDVAPQPEGET